MAIGGSKSSFYDRLLAAAAVAAVAQVANTAATGTKQALHLELCCAASANY